MLIRRAKKTDYQQIISLLNGFVEEDRYSGKNTDSFLKVLKEKNAFVYVAETSGQVVGFISFSIRRVIRYHQPIAEIDELYVAPEVRRHGLGKKLVNTILKKSQSLGCYRVFIETHYKHKAAHQLYENLGFTNYGYHFIKNL